jgi:molybdopterin molybdotransferase
LRRVFAEALRADVVVSSGGVSVGEFDYVRDVLRELGAVERFAKVAMKPGKPLTFSTATQGHGQVLCFGLPGNPASSMVSFELFVRPALRRLLGYSKRAALRPRVLVSLAGSLLPDRSRLHFVRARVARDGDSLVAHVEKKQGSGMLRSMVGINALLHIPSGPTPLEKGARVQATLLSQV